MGKGVWGIDVSKYSIKAVRLEKGPTGYTLTASHIAPIEGAGSGEEANADEQIKGTLQELKGRLRIGGERVVFSLPSHSTFNRLIKLPPVDDDKLAEVVKYEAQSQIPFPIDEVIWDYQFVDRKYAPGEEKEVILFAIKKDVVEQFLGSIQELRFNVEAVQFGPVALYNFIDFDQGLTGSNVAIDMGGDNTDLIILDGAKFWVRNLPITGNDITKALQKAFNIPFAEAEKLKIKAAQSQQAQKIFNAVQPVLRDLVSEIQRSIGYYKSISKASKFDRIVLLGNSTRTLNFQKFVSQTLQMPAARVAKLAKIAAGGSVDPAKLNEDLTTICTAIGLALQGFGDTTNQINLLPDAFKKKKELRKKQPYVAGVAAALYALVIVMGVNSQAEVSALSAVREKGQQTQSALDEARKRYTDAKGKLASLKCLQHEICAGSEECAGPLDKLASISSERDLVLQVMNQIHPNLPKNGNRALSDNDRLWILDWSFREEAAIQPTTSSSSSSSAPGRPAARVLPQDRKLTVSIEGAITRRADNTEAGNYVIKTLLGWDGANNLPDKSRPVSIVDHFKLRRDPRKDLSWRVEIVGPTGVLKPLERLKADDEPKNEEEKRFMRFRAVLTLPVGAENRTASQKLDKADDAWAAGTKDEAKKIYTELLAELPYTWVVRAYRPRIEESAK